MDFHLKIKETCRSVSRRPFKECYNKGSDENFKQKWELGPSINATSFHSHVTGTSLNLVIMCFDCQSLLSQPRTRAVTDFHRVNSFLPERLCSAYVVLKYCVVLPRCTEHEAETCRGRWETHTFSRGSVTDNSKTCRKTSAESPGLSPS